MAKQIQVLKNPIAEFTAKYGINPREVIKQINPINIVKDPKTSPADVKRAIETSDMIGKAMKAISEYNKAFQNMHIQLKRK